MQQPGFECATVEGLGIICSEALLCPGGDAPAVGISMIFNARSRLHGQSHIQG